MNSGLMSPLKRLMQSTSINKPKRIMTGFCFITNKKMLWKRSNSRLKGRSSTYKKDHVGKRQKQAGIRTEGKIQWSSRLKIQDCCQLPLWESSWVKTATKSLWEDFYFLLSRETITILRIKTAQSRIEGPFLSPRDWEDSQNLGLINFKTTRKGVTIM